MLPPTHKKCKLAEYCINMHKYKLSRAVGAAMPRVGGRTQTTTSGGGAARGARPVGAGMPRGGGEL